MGNALFLLIATAAQLALLWRAMTARGALAHDARRLEAVRLRHAVTTPDRKEAQPRRFSTTNSSQPAVSARSAPSSLTAIGARIADRLHRTGHGWSLRRYVQASLAIGAGLATITLVKTGSPATALLLGLATGAGLPHMTVGHVIARRQRAFITKLPEAIELLVCGLRAGLPVSETLGLVTNEVPGPVGEEFKLVTERMRIGRGMEDALIESAERLGLPEFNFFCITLAIHRETGGNLTETLVNLADVLRRRAAMSLKIRALSSESRASAMILGALPFVVFAIIWAADASYLAAFFTDQRLVITGLFSVVWMSIGAVVMAKLVSFDI